MVLKIKLHCIPCVFAFQVWLQIIFIFQAQQMARTKLWGLNRIYPQRPGWLRQVSTKVFYYNLNTHPPKPPWWSPNSQWESIWIEDLIRVINPSWMEYCLYKPVQRPPSAFSLLPSGPLPGVTTCAPESRPSPLNLAVSWFGTPVLYENISHAQVMLFIQLSHSSLDASRLPSWEDRSLLKSHKGSATEHKRLL